MPYQNYVHTFVVGYLQKCKLFDKLVKSPHPLNEFVLFSFFFDKSTPPQRLNIPIRVPRYLAARSSINRWRMIIQMERHSVQLFESKVTNANFLHPQNLVPSSVQMQFFQSAPYTYVWLRAADQPANRFWQTSHLNLCVCSCICSALSSRPWLMESNGGQLVLISPEKITRTRHTKRFK